ncbi:MAG: mRNA-binding ribosome synthesis protein nop7, partial [Bogoriella megaspora]
LLGIYPREPRNKKKVSKSSTPSTTFYYAKDIQYLLHEPLLNKFRDHKALAKKIAKALGRGEVGDAARLEKNHAPRIVLDHIIKERYPTFVDALRDLDDALSMLFLFANLPSTIGVPPKTISLCQRLCLEFEHYLIATHSLKKSFLSIKGIYYQATIQSQDIMWLVPYKFVQRTSGDIDFRIMGTFVEFYTTLLGFVNYRLYTSIGLKYPPKFNQSADDRGGELGAFTLEGREFVEPQGKLDAPNGTNGTAVSEEQNAAAQAQADLLLASAPPDDEVQDGITNGQNLTITQVPTGDDQEPSSTDAIDTFTPAAQESDILPQPQVSSNEAASLFSSFTFYLSRETPRHPLEFLLKAFGCKRVGWDAMLGDGAFMTNENDPNITHQVVDRPPVEASVAPEPAANGDEEDGDEASDTQRRAIGYPHTRVVGRTYVQPQWVWDCLNAGKVLRPDFYAPGATLPPHLSPWVKPKKGQYDPTQPLEAQEAQGEREIAEAEAEEQEAIALENEMEQDFDEESEEDEMKAIENNPLFDHGDDVEAGEGMDIAASDEGSSDEQEAAAPDLEDDFAGFDSDSDVEDQDDPNILHQRELEAEARGVPVAALETGKGKTKSKSEELKKKEAKRRKAEEEELQRRKTMMTRKKRKTYDRMMFGNAKRDTEAEKLRAKRRKLERG